MKVLSCLLYLSLPLSAVGFAVRPACLIRSSSSSAATLSTRLWYTEEFPSDTSEEQEEEVSAIPVHDIDPEAIRLKDEIMDLADSTKRGFKASSADRERVDELVKELMQYTSTKEPASAYYEKVPKDPSGPTLEGKWTLVYTDAPDITSLDFGGPLASAKLGRIGQECNPPQINNVIEWRRPDWAASLPLSGTDKSRVLQKVCTEGMATPEEPTKVNLKLVGLNLLGRKGGSEEITSTNTVTESKTGSSMFNFIRESGNAMMNAIRSDGLPVGILETKPVEWKGPLSAPFGQFEILYLDDSMRVIRTSQGYLAINVRSEKEWF